MSNRLDTRTDQNTDPPSADTPSNEAPDTEVQDAGASAGRLPGDGHRVASVESLAALYPPAQPRALAKESPVITPSYAELIAAAPFCVVATRGDGGLDLSPRGDPAGFVQVVDERTLLLPDRRGNNRLDTLRNLIADDEIGLLFLIPGVGEAIRVRGTAIVSADPALLARFEINGVLPATVLVVTVHRVYFQCQRAIKRSRLWDPDSQVERASLPSTGHIQQELGLMTKQAADAYDAELDEYTSATLYSGATKA